MKQVLILILIFLLSLLFFQCENDITSKNYQDIVIQAYLYEGETVTDIRISQTLPIGDTASAVTPINDAIVHLMKGDKLFELSPSVGDSGYYHYDGNDLVISENNEFTLKVNYFGKEAYASTTIPPAPRNGTLTDTTLYIPQNMNFNFDSLRHEIKVSWDVDEDAMYFVYIRCIDPNPVKIQTPVPPRGLPGRMVEMPMSQNFYTILFEDVAYYGRYQVMIYRINKEYVDLYISRNQNTRELNEPLTNIVNGLGVFSAFNHVDLFFTVVPDR